MTRNRSSLPADVIAFIRKYIDSIEQLEILLCLYNHPDKSWLPQEIAKELRSSSTSAAEKLQGFVRKNIASEEPDTDKRYKYAPESEELRTAIAKLVDVYHVKRLTVMEEIFSKPNEKIKVLADAFKLKQDN